jgi:flagellar hook-length control protein FliK
MRNEPIAPGAAVSAVEQTRLGAAESLDSRLAASPVETSSDIRGSGVAALFAAPAGVRGVDASSSHSVQAAVANARTPSALDPVVEADLPRQIVQAMRLQWKEGVGEARIRLTPDYLGEVTVAIRVEHGSVTAALEASTPAVRQWIESHEPILRQALAEQGLHLDRLIVTDEPQQTSSEPEQRRQNGDEQHQPEPRARRRKPADDTTFEVIV